MADNKILSKLADVPVAKPGFEALGMSAPFIVQMNPNGKWENSAPENLEEEGLRAVIQRIVNSKAIDAAQSYCCQCAAENKTSGMQPKYVPVVMMPIYPSDQCPFDMDCEVQKIKDAERTKTKTTKTSKVKSEAKEDDKDKDRIMKTKKRNYQLQRLTDFDLLSQW